MKKYLALLLALVMSLSLFACGKKEGDDNKDKDKTEYKVAIISPPAITPLTVWL